PASSASSHAIPARHSTTPSPISGKTSSAATLSVNKDTKKAILGELFGSLGRLRTVRRSHHEQASHTPSLLVLCLPNRKRPGPDDAATRKPDRTHAQTRTDARVHTQSQREYFCSARGGAARD